MTEQNSQSPLYRTIEKRLKRSLAEFIATRRRYYPWACIARELCDLAEVEVSDETLRRWFADADLAEADSERAA